MNLLTISGSLRADSFNTRLLAHSENLARDAGQRVYRFDRVSEIPPFNEDDEQRSFDAVTDLRDAVRRSDAVLIATPEYSGSIPGQLKNLLDWAARPADQGAFIRLPAAVISASPSDYGGAWARESAEHVLTRMGANVQSTGWGLTQAHQRATDGGGIVIDPDTEQQLRMIIMRLTAAQAPSVATAGHQTTAVVGL